ncbi:hypothetical protein EI427_15520 [Flammeovirga pectinis]|uniref:Uncharacterized protein n=2 Tax=Flammeovirga pectinis TaxID=2494373 RepID=A0A3Q9FQB7_9BACT|nr:hypothetical protein EI427_15520 [Flammeovirga pectinis]
MGQNNKDQSLDNKNSNQNDEIDLIDLFSIIGNKVSQLFKGIWSMVLAVLVYSYTKIYQFKIIIIIGVLVGGMLGYLSKNTSQYYASKATVKSQFLTGVDFSTELNELNALCTDEGRPMLAKALNLPLATVENISEIVAEGYFVKYRNNLEQDSLYYRALEDETRFQINIKTSVQSITKTEIQEGFDYFFSNNEYIKKRMTIHKENLNRNIETTQKEIEVLNEFSDAYKQIIIQQSKIQSTTKSNSNVLLFKSSEEEGLVKQSGDLALQAMGELALKNEELKDLSTQLILVEPVQFVNRFSELYTVSLSTGGKTLIGMFIGFMIVIGVLLLLDINTFMKKAAKL